MNRAKKEKSETKNAAYHVLSVKEKTNNQPFLKSVKHISGVQCPISDTLYRPADSGYKKLCCKESGSVLCIDKAFNLGECHAAPTVYKALSVV